LPGTGLDLTSVRTVKVVQRLRAPADVVFAAITEGRQLSQWFAQSGDLRLGESVRLDFGDGDFFSARVVALAPPRRLELEWRFMNLGPTFRIGVEVESRDGESELVVIDQGAASDAEARSLEEGWADFLARLMRWLRTGENTRYRWSDTISLAAFAAQPVEAVIDLIGGERWWRRWFPSAHVINLGVDGSAMSVELKEPPWLDGTRARVTVTNDGRHTRVDAVHSGWVQMPEAIQVAERRRYAEAWCAALTELERGQQAAKGERS
jgi:uncharacterized protein YndB with AHSA1/START domain